MRDYPGKTESAKEPAGSISCYLGEVPAFVKAELEQLYGHLFSSLPFFEIFRPVRNVCTYVATRDGQPSTILVFENAGRRIHVLNEMIHIEEREILRFADYVFARFPSVAIISFKAIRTGLQPLPYPYQRYNAKEDFVITLPDTPEQYTSRIGSATRRNIKRYMSKLIKDFPTFRHQFYVNEEIKEHHIREIIRLSEIRISAKRKRFGIAEDEIRCIVNLARICGLVNVMSIDGRLCAGTIAFRTGCSYLAMVNAHDPDYDDYWLGTLCYYLTICESIGRGGKRFHMGGGRYDYKNRLLGNREDMDQLEIYRSYGRALLNIDNMAKALLKSRIRKAKIWLLEREKSAISQFVLRAVFFFSKLQRYIK